MKLRVDVRRFLASAAPEPADRGALAVEDGAVDLRRLPWEDGAFAAIELDDVPDPAAWTHAGPALNECRRVLKRNGMLEVRTRRKAGRAAQVADAAVMRALSRLLQNHGFDVVSMDTIDDDGALISALALRSDGPEDVFDDAVAAPDSHVTLHGPLLEGNSDASASRALAVSLDEMGVKVRVRVIFDVVDALSFD